MKKVIVTSFVVLSLITFVGVSASSFANTTTFLIQSKTEIFKVYGNCGMCKKRIESSLSNVDGVENATWDVKTKMLNVTFDSEVVSLHEIKENIASVGHDTDEVRATEKVYNKLPGCCQYERAK